MGETSRRFTERCSARHRGSITADHGGLGREVGYPFGVFDRPALKLIGKYPTGKGANWVEIVSFD
jgi:hypothetical protein